MKTKQEQYFTNVNERDCIYEGNEKKVKGVKSNG